MVTELDYILTKFSPVNHTCCFAHILNLVAKSLLKQFDVKQDDKKAEDLNDDEQSLLELAGNIEDEEHTMAQEKDDVDREEEEEEDLEGWVDKVEALTLEEQENLANTIRPVKRMLVKVKKIWKVLT